MTEPLTASTRWRSHPVLAYGLRSALVLLPVAAGVGAAFAFYHLGPVPGDAAGEVWRWAGTVVIAAAAIFGVDRLARRLLPLAALLEMSLPFPARAPDRYRMALRAGSVRRLKADLARQSAEGVTPVEAAETIVSLLVATPMEDGRTRGRSERTRACVDEIATRLGIPACERERLGWATLLHDVGELVVEPTVRTKEGALDDVDRDAIRRHPEVGGRLVEPLRGFLGDWVDAVAHHHERWDGTGYPMRLAGADINRGARIVAVVDAYEAMTSPRPYRKPVSPEAARAEIALQAGIQFDPEVVRALLSVPIARLNRLTAPPARLLTLPFTAKLRRVVDGLGSSGAGPALSPGRSPAPGGGFEDARPSLDNR